MKSVALLLFLFVFAGDCSFAQSSMLAGKIVDEDNTPVAGATVRLRKADKVIDTRSDNDGLFYTQLLPCDLYRLEVIFNDKLMKAGKVYLSDTKKLTEYYYLRITGDKVHVKVDGEDGFMQARLGNLKSMSGGMYDNIIFDENNNGGNRSESFNHDPVGIYREHFFIKIKDSTSGKLIPMYGPVVPPPGMR